MRYFIQVVVMAGDLALIFAAAYLVSVSAAGAWLAIPTFWVWHRQGGFMAWSPASVRQFMDNAKRLGL